MVHRRSIPAARQPDLVVDLSAVDDLTVPADYTLSGTDVTFGAGSASGATETVTLTHTARDRSALARGALVAARWVDGRRGWSTMRDVLG